MLTSEVLTLNHSLSMKSVCMEANHQAIVFARLLIQYGAGNCKKGYSTFGKVISRFSE